MLEKISVQGHKNILCTHPTTIEITKANYVTRKGTCILGIKASKACSDLNERLKREIWKGKKFKIIIQFEDLSDSFHGYGSPHLPLTNERDMVFRKSDYICDRTVLIRCDKASMELNRDLLKKITTSNKPFYLIFELADFNE
ncbi:MAG: DUF371 domain-containing protein [Promethearchaeota archaeon]